MLETDVAEAMQQFEQNIAQQSAGQTLTASERQLNRDSGAMPVFVTSLMLGVGWSRRADLNR